MTIETWPTSPTPSFSYPLEDEYITEKFQSQGMGEQANSLSRFPFHRFVVGYENLYLSSEWPTFHSFHTSRKGAWDPFWYFDFVSRSWVDIYVGRGDGSTDTFDLHSKETVNDSTLKIYVDGVLKTKTVDYNFVSGGGGGGADRITFLAGHIPAAGTLITSDFNGKLRIKARKDDKFSDRLISPTVITIETFLIREVQW